MFANGKARLEVPRDPVNLEDRMNVLTDLTLQLSRSVILDQKQ